MIEVQVHPEWVVLGEHLAEFVIDALWHEDWNARTDANDLNVWDIAQAAQDLLKEFWRKGEPVAAADQYVAHLWRASQVVELRFVILGVEVLRWITNDARTCAVAAVRGALRGNEHQHAIWVAVHKSRYWRVSILAERVFHHCGERLLLRSDWDHLAADRIVWILWINKADEVRRDVNAELSVGGESFALVVCQLKDLADLFKRVDAVRELPAPVVPLLVRNVLPLWSATAAERETVRADRLGGVARIHPCGISGCGCSGVALQDLRCVHLVPLAGSPGPRLVG